MPELRRIVIELLGQLGSSREARQYLKQFSRVEESRFAVVKVGGAVMRDDLEELAAALAFLHRLGLTPIVLHGAGPQLDEAMHEAGVPVEKREGLRVTTEEVMAVARPVIYRSNASLVDALEARGVRARGIQHGVFNASLVDPEKLGLVGEIASVELEPVQSAISGGALPVVACLGESPSGQVMNINADIAARELVWAVKPHKVIFLTGTGGLLDHRGRIISAISLVNDYEHLLAQDWVHSGMRLKLKQIRDMLEQLPGDASVSITSAGKLTRELFTHTGAGTLIRRGERIEHYDRIPEKRLDDLVSLLQSSFGRKLRPDWLQHRRVSALLMAESGRAAALLVEGLDGLPYLDKFVVTPEAQGEGLGAALWQAVRQHCPALYWRARSANPIASWYFQQAHATCRRGEWVVYSIGITDQQRHARLIDDAFDRDSGWMEEGEPNEQ
ncbi:acetylglutamate kinase [Wenzhouxiangella sp. AB-CW3]|uniref:acetylglutamate kinase n=1 Tax=Wenzhouxiangella sp. AB-CW3 TaxID=2771012 RepID=UPI00168BC2A3|nr:acetylglutamate kinase [Wenzhouxiangella sp. AB-CW3]QOC22709.1 acetylglutamate kinase [Wenzhouxiangella sp. AB-CW3]